MAAACTSTRSIDPVIASALSTLSEFESIRTSEAWRAADVLMRISSDVCRRIQHEPDISRASRSRVAAAILAAADVVKDLADESLSEPFETLHQMVSREAAQIEGRM